MEQQNTPEQWQNNGSTAEHSGKPTEHQANVTPPENPEQRNHTKQITFAVILNKI